MSDVIFTTIHGSHLYGFAGPDSDRDTYTVTTSSRRASHRQSGQDDNVTIGLDRFLEYAWTGSHQACEALFSPYKVWHSRRFLEPMLDGMRIGGAEVLAKYRRTITKFAHADDFKRRRHACRLWMNMQDLRAYGRFDPVVRQPDIAWMNALATGPYDRGELADLLREGDWERA